MTDHRQVERELREANERFARIFHNAPIGEAIVAPGGRFLQVNRALCEIVGYPEHELLEKTFQDITHPDDLDADLEFVRQMLAGEIRTYEMEKRYFHKLGHVVWILLSVSLVRDEEGEPVSFVSQIQDITERIEAERQLREAELRYRTLVEQLPLAMYIRPLDMADSNIYCSPKVQDLLGYTAEEWESDPGILGRTVHPEDVQYAIDSGERVRRTGEPFRGEYRYVHRDGRIVWMQDETYLIRDDAGEPVGVQGFLLDITERKQAEAERDRLQDELHHAQKIEAIGQLAGGVAHEFNNTLTAITAYSSLMLARLQPDSPLRHDVEQVIGSAERAATLTRQLLAFGRKQVLQPRAIELNEIVRTSIELLQPLVHPGIRLRTNLDETVPVTEADPAQIEQVIVNLVLNARDAIEDEGTITIGTRLIAVDGTAAEQHDVEPGEFLELRVDDTGSGMDEETRSHIFEPFFTTKAEGKGTGLGLSTAYGIARQGGGCVTVETEPGDGTTMTVLLPLRAAQTHPAVETVPRRVGARRHGTRRRRRRSGTRGLRRPPRAHGLRRPHGARRPRGARAAGGRG